MRELRQRVRPFRAESFSLNLSGGSPSADGGSVAAPAAGAKRKDNLRFSFLFELLPFPCFLIWRRLPTCDRSETGVRQSGYRSVSFVKYSQRQINYCYTCGFIYAERGITVPHNSLTCYTARHLRIRRLILFIFAGAVYYNALTNCATRSCCACLDEITCVADRYLTLRTGYEKHGRKNPLPFPIFEAVTYRKFAPD